jgi:hypothetical protein
MPASGGRYKRRKIMGFPRDEAFEKWWKTTHPHMEYSAIPLTRAGHKDSWDAAWAERGRTMFQGIEPDLGVYTEPGVITRIEKAIASLERDVVDMKRWRQRILDIFQALLNY